jgi:hypothetical protein
MLADQTACVARRARLAVVIAGVGADGAVCAADRLYVEGWSDATRDIALSLRRPRRHCPGTFMQLSCLRITTQISERRSFVRTSLVLLGAAMVGIAALGGSASAQSVGIYVGPADSDYYHDGLPAYPRTYRYSDTFGDGVVVRRYSRGGCGTYRYWDGDRCVDARWR